jgi:hypothetical protein
MDQETAAGRPDETATLSGPIARSPQREAYERCRRRVRTLVRPGDSRVQVPSCPQWSVHDLCAHLSGVAVALASGDTEADDAQNWIDDQEPP